MIDPIDLHAYVDGELGSDESAAIQADIDAHPELYREIEAIKNLKHLLMAKCEPVQSRQTWLACLGRLKEIDRAKRVDLLVGRLAPAICGVLFLCILLAGVVNKHNVENSTRANFAQIISGLSKLHPPKATADNDQAQARWLNALLKQSRLSTPDQLQIRSVSEGLVNHVRVRKFAVRDANGDLAIMLFANPMYFDGMTPVDGHPNLKSMKLDGLNYVARNDGSQTVMVIADRSDNELAAVLAKVAIKPAR